MMMIFTPIIHTYCLSLSLVDVDVNVVADVALNCGCDVKVDMD